MSPCQVPSGLRRMTLTTPEHRGALRPGGAAAGCSRAAWQVAEQVPEPALGESDPPMLEVEPQQALVPRPDTPARRRRVGDVGHGPASRDHMIVDLYMQSGQEGVQAVRHSRSWTPACHARVDRHGVFKESAISAAGSASRDRTGPSSSANVAVSTWRSAPGPVAVAAGHGLGQAATRLVVLLLTDRDRALRELAAPRRQLRVRRGSAGPLSPRCLNLARRAAVPPEVRWTRQTKVFTGPIQTECGRRHDS